MNKSFPFFLLNAFLISYSFSQKCGVERWSVKTLSDADTSKIDFTKVIPSNIQEQSSMQQEHGRQNSRLTSEEKVYSIGCAIVGFKREADQDIHIIIEDTLSEETMVVEIISPSCAPIEKTSRYILFKNLEDWFIINVGHPSSNFTFLKKHIPVVLTGIGFFDFCHGQKGMAENCREIHPVLSMVLIQ